MTPARALHFRIAFTSELPKAAFARPFPGKGRAHILSQRGCRPSSKTAASGSGFPASANNEKVLGALAKRLGVNDAGAFADGQNLIGLDIRQACHRPARPVNLNDIGRS